MILLNDVQTQVNLLFFFILVEDRWGIDNGYPTHNQIYHPFRNGLRLNENGF